MRTTAVDGGEAKKGNVAGGAAAAAEGPRGEQQRVVRELGKLSGAVIETSITGPRRVTAKVKAENIVDVCRKLRDFGFDHLSSLTCIDYDTELAVVYHLWSYRERCLIELRASISGTDPKIASVTSVWTGAEFHERETFDMFGVLFEGCPNLKRVLLPEEWSVYPLRKSFRVESIHEKKKKTEAEKAKGASQPKAGEAQ